MFYRELTERERTDIKERILFEDNHLLVFNKACGQIVQGDKTGDEPLCETLKAYIAGRDGKPGQVFLGIPHRLDRPVSGLTIFAKTSKALERLSAMFRDGNVHKSYIALTCAPPPAVSGSLENWLGRNEAANKSFICRSGTPGAKLAKLNYRILSKTERYWMVEVELLTGRHHQIRCQLAGAGCPIKGDLKYGAPRSNRDGGICLHSAHVNFLHPVKHIPVEVEAPLPCNWPGSCRTTGRESDS